MIASPARAEGLVQDEKLVRDMLSRYGSLTRDHVARYLPPDGDRDYLSELIVEYPRRGGKMLRPALCLATACAFGADPEDALGCAASIEMMHNALLIHDDIEDDSEQRRGRPTLHAMHGIPLALNAGDALYLLSFRPLRENAARLSPLVARRIFDEAERMAWETTEGQAMELGWRRENRFDIGDDDYLTMVLKKTCWLTTIYPMRVGGLIGGGSADQVKRMFRLGFFFGAAFQIQDDLLNIEGGEDYGKERCGDLLEGKRTLMLVHAIRHAGARDRARMLRFLAMPRARRKIEDVEWLRDLIYGTGAIDHARATAEALAGAALYEFEGIFQAVPDGADKQFLQTLVTWVLARVR
jgi:geranylgeranyl diphosphate synthase, type II